MDSINLSLERNPYYTDTKRRVKLTVLYPRGPRCIVYPFYDAPRWIKSGKLHLYIRRGWYPDAKCWYSGIPLNFVFPQSYHQDKTLREIPWLVTREHLVPTRLQSDNNYPINIVFCGKYLNSQFGHSPFVIKLAAKREISRHTYDLNPTIETARYIFFDIVVPFFNQFKYKGKFLWCPTQENDAINDQLLNKFWACSSEFDKDLFNYYTVNPDIDCQTRNTFLDTTSLEFLNEFKQ